MSNHSTYELNLFSSFWEQKKERLQISFKSGETDDICLRSARRAARGQWISHIARGTGTDSSVVSCLTFRVLTTSSITGGSAVVIIAGLIK